MTRLPSLGPRGEGWVAIQLLLLLAVALAGLLAGGAWAGWPAVLTSLLGASLIAAGSLLLIRGLFDLGHSLTPMPRPLDDGALVQHGAYALVRHPLYGGLTLGSFGWALLTASPAALLLAALTAIFFDLKSRREEAWLIAHYPGYAAYRRRTRRLIPWVY